MTPTPITSIGPPMDDPDLLARLPSDLADLLRRTNGFSQFDGGLHVRGACQEPAWHSLRHAWLGEAAIHESYPAVGPDDVPFAEDCLGDQFLLRDGVVWRLSAETGDVESLEVGLLGFLEAASADPVEFLSLHPLLQFRQDGGTLEPGQLLSVYPPFCTKEAANGVSLAAVPSDDRRRFLADLAAQLRDIPDGAKVDFQAEG